jgi:hypothetical protein
MADPNLLASILSGQDPLAPQMTQGLQGAQLSATAAANPEATFGPIGVLAKFLGASQGHDMLNNAVQQTTQARTAARPELAQLLAQPDPYAAAAQGQHSPLAMAGILGGATPENVAQTREAAARAQFLGAQANLANRTAQPMPPMYAPAAAARPTGVPSAGGVSLPGTGRYPSPQAAGEAADPIAQAMTLPLQQRAALQGQQRAQIIAQLRARMMAAQQAAAAHVAQSGPGNAAGP